MKVTLIRYSSTPKSTLGLLFIDGLFHCYTLEDQRQTVKVKGETRIPAGVYPVQLRTAGRLHERYKTRFPEMHHGMLHLKHVKDFEWIYLHIGNTVEDTSGCILLGNSVESRLNAAGRVNQSTDAYLHIYPIICNALLKGEKVLIDVCGV